VGIPVFILGASGTGKTYGLKNLKPDEYGLVSVEKTTLPFLSAKKFAHLKDFEAIRKAMEAYSDAYRCVMVDDLGYAVVDLFMRHIYDRDQFTIYKTIADELYRTCEFVNEKIELLGMTNFVLLADVVDGEHVYIVNDKPPAKTPEGLFDEPKQPNDLQLIDTRIREAMGLKPRKSTKSEKKEKSNA